METPTTPPESDGKRAERPSNRTKRARGRPSKFSEETVERMLQAIRSGAMLNAAAAYAGIHPSTLHDWWVRGRRAKSGRLKEFSDAVDKALAEAEMRATVTIVKAGEKDWKAAIAYLERRFPRRWGRRRFEESTIKGAGPGGAIPVEHRGLVISVLPSREVTKDGRVKGEAPLPSLGNGAPQATGSPVPGAIDPLSAAHDGEDLDVGHDGEGLEANE